MVSFHSNSKCCPVFKSVCINNHQTFLLEFAGTCVGFKFPFLVGCHCEATFGLIVERSLNPVNTFFPLNYGQQVPLLLRDEIEACHSKL